MTQPTSQQAPFPLPHRARWFYRDRFGMFIHWGLYAMPARHEWVKNKEKLSDEHYQRYFQRFDPDLYDPAAWARTARKTGMKYVVVTTKHHDGFCLWDSALTEYKAPNTPAGQDLLAPLVEAFRAEGLRIGFYHSLLDWHHPDYPLDRCHPLRIKQDPHSKTEGRNMQRYVEYLYGQVRELLSNFGTIDLMFFDFSIPGEDGKGRDDWQSRKLLDMVRSLQPDILVNDRLDLRDEQDGWDYLTPEQHMPSSWPERNGRRVVWETCQTFSGSWGYHRDESEWKSPAQLIGHLVETVSKGGNLLLNVGPTARGTLDDRATQRLDAIGHWMHFHARSIYGCTQAPPDIPIPANALLTWNPDRRRLYLHLLHWPVREYHVPGLEGRIQYAQMLHDGSEIQFRTRSTEIHEGLNAATPEGAVTLLLPVRKPALEVPVVELFLD